MNFSTAFKESSGEWSMRRLLAFLFGLAGIVASILCIFHSIEWKTVAVAVGLPFASCLVLLLFTTWADVEGIVSAAKGKK
ncbi:MAG: hypothetical protein HDR52_06285 [Treponema sp.]|nr:hypothetical protein [Treponema sp.]